MRISIPDCGLYINPQLLQARSVSIDGFIWNIKIICSVDVVSRAYFVAVHEDVGQSSHFVKFEGKWSSTVRIYGKLCLVCLLL